MKATRLVALIALFLFGCASTARMNAPDQAALMAENARLREEIARSRPAPQEASNPGPGPMAPMIPPARPQAFGPPQFWGWLNTPPAGCERGPLALAIPNRTDKDLAISLDGQAIMIRGAVGVLPAMSPKGETTLPPHEVLYLCLAEPGEHVVSGTAYVRRPVAIGVPHSPVILIEMTGTGTRFTIRRSLGSGPLAMGRNEVEIDEATFLMYASP